MLEFIEDKTSTDINKRFKLWYRGITMGQYLPLERFLPFFETPRNATENGLDVEVETLDAVYQELVASFGPDGTDVFGGPQRMRTKFDISLAFGNASVPIAEFLKSVVAERKVATEHVHYFGRKRDIVDGECRIPCLIEGCNHYEVGDLSPGG